MTIFIISFFFILIVSIIGMHFVEKSYVVQAQGAVSVEDESYLSPKTHGVITEIYAKPGDFVEMGEVILRLSSGNEGLQQYVAESKIKELEDTLLIMNKYEEALSNGKNILGELGKEVEFHSKASYYLDLVEQEKIEKNKLHQKIKEKKKELESIRAEIKNINPSYENAEYSESEAAIENSKVEGLEEEIKQLEEEIATPSSQARQAKLQLLSESGEKRIQIENQLTELRANEKVAIKQDSIHEILASSSGVLHYLQPLSVGMSVQQNQTIAEIADIDKGFFIDTYIQAKDISRVDISQKANISIVGVNDYRFGILHGEIESIEPGVIQNETPEGIVSFYRAKVNISADELQSKSGKTIDLIRSMPVEVKIVYKEETYLEWLLDLLNLISK